LVYVLVSGGVWAEEARRDKQHGRFKTIFPHISGSFTNSRSAPAVMPSGEDSKRYGGVYLERGNVTYRRHEVHTDSTINLRLSARRRRGAPRVRKDGAFRLF
jgi:hypothetical protein